MKLQKEHFYSYKENATLHLQIKVSMIDFTKISRLGIGTYKMTINDNNHQKAFEYALGKGINLIDTASNYQFGNSEKLIGSMLKGMRKKVFLISKSGYIQGDDIKSYSYMLSSPRTIKISDNFLYSINSSFLEAQIIASLKRLNTDYLDGFLIHNPEHYFDIINKNQPYIYEHLTEACEFLESMVKKGVIRYYGISSNVLPTNGIDLSKILSNNDFPHFKLAQFPHNLVENEAIKKGQDDSLIGFCRKNKIKTFANRPLNTKYQGKVLRLADYYDEYLDIDFKEEEVLFQKFLKNIREQLLKFGEISPLENFTPIQFFIKNRKNIANPEAVKKAINSYLIPFVKQLQFSDSSIEKMIYRLSEYWILYSKKYITERSGNLKNKLKFEGVIKKNDNRDISLIACENYLNSGIDHVLVGMRKKKYVDNLLNLL